MYDDKTKLISCSISLPLAVLWGATLWHEEGFICKGEYASGTPTSSALISSEGRNLDQNH